MFISINVVDLFSSIISIKVLPLESSLAEKPCKFGTKGNDSTVYSSDKSKKLHDFM